MFGIPKVDKNVGVVLVLTLLSACTLLPPEPGTPPGILAPPTGVLVTPQRDQILVTWQDNSDNEIGFTVYRDTLGDGRDVFAKRAELPADTTRFGDTDIQAGVSYRYAVAANGDGFRSSKVEQKGDAVTPTPNGAPTADAQERSTSENEAVTLNLSGADPDGDRLSFFVETEPQHGSLGEIDSAGKVVYTPDTGFTGEDSFSFKVSDGVLDSAPAPVTVTVLPMGVTNTAPVAEPGRVVTQRGEAATVQLSASDADGDTVEYLIETAPTNGTLDLSQLAKGTVVYRPAADFAGEDSFRFKVNDGLDDSNVATVDIRTNQAPRVVKEIGTQAVYRLDRFDLDVSRVFSDADGDSLELSADGLPASLQLSEGRVQGTPEEDEVGSYEVTLTARDGWGGSEQTSFTLRVTETCPADSYEVRFADVNLRRKVSAKLNTTVLTCRDMKRLTNLVADGSGSNRNKITSLDGLEHARNLTTLNLADNLVSDISALETLNALTTLNLTGNAIADLTPLAQRTGLTDLQLSQNEIADISALAKLTKLTVLNLSANSIGDIEALGKLTNLTTLTLSNNEISDISALSDLTKLTTLSLPANEISNIEALSDLTELRDLNLESNRVTDLAPLAGLTKMQTLDLSFNRVNGVSALAGMTALTELELNNANNQGAIRSISGLSQLRNLIRLNLENNEIQNTSALYSLRNLEVLIMGGNDIENTRDLERLNKLEVLNLFDNDIDDIGGLAGLLNLQYVELGNNDISDIAPLVRNATVSDASKGLGEGDEVRLFNNRSIPAAQVQALRDEGVTVLIEE